MADNDRWRNDQDRGRYGSRGDQHGRAEGRYEDFGGRPDEGRFTGEGGGSRDVGGRYEPSRYGGQSRYAEQGRYEDFGGRPDRGRFTGEGGGSGGSGSGGYRGGSGHENRGRYGGEDRGDYGYGSGGGREGGFGGDYYSGFYGADQNYGRGRSEDRIFGGSSGYAGSQRGYLDRPQGDAWRRAADQGGYGREDDRRGGSGGSGRGEDRGFFGRVGDEVASWFGSDDAARRRERDAWQGDPGHRGRGPRGYARSDDRIREDVNDRLTDDPYVDASDIEVSVANREVTLSGTVDSRETKRRAEDIAESVAGVAHVQNNLRVADRSQGVSSRSVAAQSVTEPPLGESITAMNSSDANRIARETFGPMEDTTDSKRR